jgi:hypothetical protein
MIDHMVWKTQMFINVQNHNSSVRRARTHTHIYIYIHTHTYILPGSRITLDKINVVPRYLLVAFGVLDLLNGYVKSAGFSTK